MIDGNFHIMKSSQRQAEWHICPLNGDAPELTWADGEINRTVRYFPTPHAALSAIREWQRREPMNEVLP